MEFSMGRRKSPEWRTGRLCPSLDKWLWHKNDPAWMSSSSTQRMRAWVPLPHCLSHDQEPNLLNYNKHACHWLQPLQLIRFISRGHLLMLLLQDWTSSLYKYHPDIHIYGGKGKKTWRMRWLCTCCHPKIFCKVKKLGWCRTAFLMFLLKYTSSYTIFEYEDIYV